MHYSIAVEEETSRIVLKGHFNLNANLAFRNSYRQALGQRRQDRLEVHMGEVEHIDTSGLGMLLLLHREASQHGVEIMLNECPPKVKRMLKEASFDRLFAIRGKLQ